MTIVNPYSDDPERAPPFEQGYLAAYAAPDEEHFPPLEGERLDIYKQGEEAGRRDRQNEPNEQDPLPSEVSDDFSRFESAPDGTLIPIPTNYPSGVDVRSDATISVSPSGSGFYVVIFNGPPESHVDFAHLVTHAAIELLIADTEHLLAHAAAQGTKLVVTFGGIAVSALAVLLTPSPVLQETMFRGYLPDQRPIFYVALTPQH